MRTCFVYIILLCLPISLLSQSITISGFVTAKNNQEALIGVNIFDKYSHKGTATNEFGFYSISFPQADSITLLFSYIGFDDNEVKIEGKTNQSLNINLVTNNLLEVVEIKANKYPENTTDISLISIPIKQLKALPSFMGEKDIMRALQLMPGIQGGKEGTSGIYVRGGSPDQNLFLLDDVPLYYVGHMGGFVSIFDPNAINDVKLYKGGFPAKYGGRLSSVIDLRMKNGDLKKLRGEFSLGTITAKISVEGPIKKDTSSFFISLRRCNFDIWSRIISLYESEGKAMAGYTFYDIYGKYNWIINPKNRIYFSFYRGRDKVFTNFFVKANQLTPYSFKVNNSLKWGNTSGSFRWNHIYNSKLFGNIILAYTHYKYESTFISRIKQDGASSYTEQGKIFFGSQVSDIITKMDYDFFPTNNHKIRFGIAGKYHIFKPSISYLSSSFASSNTSSPSKTNTLVKAFELNAYVEDEFKLNKHVSANIGLRYSSYFVGTSSFIRLEPRIVINYNFLESYALKVSYVQMNQNIHLLSKSGAGMPSDLWMPATEKLKPEHSTQYTLGLAHTFYTKRFPIYISVETYYKTLKNIVEYKAMSSFFKNNNWEEVVETNGSAKIYGAELLIQKKTGKLNGWFSYTLSKNMRNFAQLNHGKDFPFRYDRRHDLSIVINYNFTDDIIFSATWVYQTGNAITLANNKYDIIDFPNTGTPDNSYILNNVHLYGSRNNYRMSDFHKLDVSISFIKHKKRGVRTWNISIYNLYAHQNPYYLFYKYDSMDKKIKLYQYSLFPFIPSLSYSFTF